MQQDKQAAVFSSPSRLSRHPGRNFRRPPLLLPFEEEHYRDSDEHARLDIAHLKTPSEGLSLRADTGISNQEMNRIPTSGTSSAELHYTPDTEGTRSSIPDSFMSQPMSYDELDERLEDELDFSRMNTVHIMHLSGIMQAIPKPQIVVNAPDSIPAKTSILSIYEDELLEKTRTLPRVPVPTAAALKATKPTPTWKVVLKHPVTKTALGLASGVAIILLLSRLIDFKATEQVLAEHLTTQEGILHASIGGLAFAIAFTLRGTRWKLFLNRISNISVSKVIRIYWIGVFINFLLPIQGGEVAKSVMLKKVAGIPMSQSLPTVAMDKALDLMPVLGIIAIVPFIPGIHMNVTLWLILGLVGGILVALAVIVVLTAWKRVVAINLIHFFMKMLPKGIGAKIEGFGMGFVDSLIEGARRPKSFIPATFLTALAILCEGIFAWQESLAIGLNTMGLGIATFGYTLFTMFSILPTPPGQVGTNEGAKVIVFTSLLGFSRDKVLAMSILSHLVGPVIMIGIGLVSIWSLGLTFSGVLNIKEEHHESKGTKALAQQSRRTRRSRSFVRKTH